MADTDVNLKHKVRLRKKVGEEDLVPPTPTDPKNPFWRQERFWLKVLGCVAVISILIVIIVKCTGTECIRTTDDKAIEMEFEEQAVSEEGAFNKNMKEDANSDEDLSSEAQPIERATDYPSVESSLTKENSTSTPTQAIVPTESRNAGSISNNVEAEAMKVIRGDYGVGLERKNKLGAQYRPIQNRVNQLKREGVF